MSDEEKLEEAISGLTRVNRELVRRQSPWRHLLNGIIYGIGATVGAGIIIAVAVWMLNQLAGFDVFRPAVENVLPYFDRSTNRSIDLETFPQATYETSSPIPSPSVEVSPQIQE